MNLEDTKISVKIMNSRWTNSQVKSIDSTMLSEVNSKKVKVLEEESMNLRYNLVKWDLWRQELKNMKIELSCLPLKSIDLMKL